jgi:hypothetical protein
MGKLLLMSRSNPTTNNSHVCTRWFDWDGAQGGIRYYDREKKERIGVPFPFSFMLLDKLATIKGFHDASDSGIFSNEVKDTTRDPFVVKAHNGPVLATGLYRDIRDKIVAVGGVFNANLYIAYKSDGKMEIGSLMFKGAGLNAWVEFENKHRKEIWEKAIKITGCEEGKKGKVIFQSPTFALQEISKEANEAATKLDQKLQQYLTAYLGRNVREQVAAPAAAQDEAPAFEPEAEPAKDDFSDVPF